MAGDPSNVMLWTEADVFVYKPAVLDVDDIPEAITDPFDTTAAWSDVDAIWGYLGMLVGADGIEVQREWDETDIPAWGYGTILVASKDFKATVTVNFREDNLVTQDILWPGSTSTSYVVPQPSSRIIALEKRTADGKKQRLISKRPARLWVPNIKDVEGDNTPRELNARIFPNSARELFQAQKSA